MALSRLDVLDVWTTCYDFRFSPLDLFSKHKAWISTGYFPQMIMLRFLKKWVFRVLEFQTTCATKVFFCISNDSNERTWLPMNHTNGQYSYDLSSEINSHLSHKDDPSSLFPLGNSITIKFISGSDDFLVIENLNIRAYQNI